MAATGVACSDCGTDLRADAKFCDECGASVTHGSTAEYKQVTVLFADVVHSMDIAATVGPERLRELMSDLLDHSTAVVERYGGTVNQFTGDGIMAVFGAPISLEDHAIRACMTALEIQRQVQALASEVRERDGIDLQLRVGLNSGEVIAGEMGSRAHSYTTMGDQVGMAQRMESVAPTGGVMLSESTARLVESHAALSERLLVQIKGTDAPVAAYELLSVTGRQSETAEPTSIFVGREWELAALTAMLDRSINGHGCAAGVVGPPGIGKSRIVAETAKLAANRGLQVYSTYCESHTSDVPFQAANRLLRSTWGVDGSDDEAARARVRSRVPGADSADLVLLMDELGIRDPVDRLPDIAPEARRRRLTALVNASVVARDEPVVYIIEDAHWIDATSESLIADFLSVIPRTNAMVLITHRPEYSGALSRSPGAQTIALAPLDDSQMTRLVLELLGPDPSVAGLAERIAERASGNPFFAEEIARDLADRKVLRGDRGAYTCTDDATDVEVPATVQAAIAARIDRLSPDAKLALNAAAVVGLRFEEGLLAELADTTAMEPLLKAELIDQVSFTPQAEYAFRHPLIRSVAYRSQLAATRAEFHRRLAAVLETRDPESADENAALIAEHLEEAGDLAEAFSWHMRAGTWLNFRDIHACRLSWKRASLVADRMVSDQPGRDAMRIGPRALLCATAFRTRSDLDDATFEETCRLANRLGDKVSVAMAMSGRAVTLMFGGRYRECSLVAAELVALLEAIGDPTWELALFYGAASAKLVNGEVTAASQMVQRVIDLADGDVLMGASVIESPLTLALMLQATARSCLGTEGWKADLAQAVTLVGEHLPIGQPDVLVWKYALGLAGAFKPDSAAVRETAEVLEIAQQRADDLSVWSARFLHGMMLAQQSASDRDRGLSMLASVREAVTQQRSISLFLPFIDMEFAKEKARHGDIDGAIRALEAILLQDDLPSGGGMGPQVRATEAMVELLLQRGEPADIAAARDAIQRLETMPVEPGVVLNAIALLRLRALLAQARGDEAEYRQFRDQYRAMANEIGFEGHIAMAEAMTSET
jgi:adenylate cyclase